MDRRGPSRAVVLVLIAFLAMAIATPASPNNAVPYLNPLQPASAAPGGPDYTLTVTGTGFVGGSLVRWNGLALLTTFVSSSKLTATVPAASIAAPTTATVTVASPTPGGGTSNPQY